MVRSSVYTKYFCWISYSHFCIRLFYIVFLFKST